VVRPLFLREVLPMSKTLRILHCLRAPVGGLFRHVIDLAGEQAARGHDVGIVTDVLTGDRLTGPRLAALEPKLTLGITRIEIPRLPSHLDVAASRHVTDVATRNGCEIIHGHGAKGGAYARLARGSLRRKGFPVASFYTPHGGTLNYRPGSVESRFYCQLERKFSAWTDGFIFESAFAHDTFSRMIGFNSVARRIIPNGLQSNDFSDVRQNTDAADFVFLGELRSVKGIDVLLNAMVSVAKSHGARAVIVGSGPSEAEMKALCSRLGLDQHVTFAGTLPAHEAFKRGRCFVVPSRSESFPYVVLEAAAAGLPMISTNVGGIPEIVHGTDVPLIPAGDVGALEAAMRAFLSEPELARDRGRRLKQNVASKFTVAGMARDIVDFYDQQLSSVPLGATQIIPQMAQTMRSPS
jgi:glycosyltransferase involved in cell wall biosynthesis